MAIVSPSGWLLCLALLYLEPCSSGIVRDGAVNNTLTLGFLISFESEWMIGPYAAAAIIVGIKEVQKRNLLPNHQIEWLWENSGCDTIIGFRGAVDLWQRSADLDVIIGPGCSTVCYPVAFLADIWNIPIISYGCFGTALSDKTLYPTFSRSVQTGKSLSPVYVAVVHTFGWRRVAILTSTQTVSVDIALFTKELLEGDGVQVIYRTVESSMIGDQVDEEALQAMQEVVRSLKSQARIVILQMYPTDIRNFLLTCLDEGMLNGDYVFLTNDQLDTPEMSFSHRPEVGSEIFTGFLSVEPTAPSGRAWDEFQHNVLEEFEHPAFDGYYTLSVNDSIDNVLAWAGFVHDAVLIWAYGANATLESGASVDDGRDVTSNILNLRFNGITGDVAISENGDRLVDNTVYSLQPGAEDIVLLQWIGGDAAIVPVYSNDTPSEWQDIPWSMFTTTVPTGFPACGWDREFCIKTEAAPYTSLAIGLPVFTVIVFLCLIALVPYYRKMRQQMKLKETLALILHKDDVVEGRDAIDQRVMSVFSFATINFGGVAAGGDEIMHPQHVNDALTFGRYNDLLVAVHTFHYGRSKAELLEFLGEMRGLSHDNLNPFRGVVLGQGQIKTVYDFAPKRSIQSLIEDGQFRLTVDIKISFLSDITAGMLYLQHSAHTGHGHLNSANCVVDSRWTCKITDYGLQFLHPISEMEEIQKLWCAPEVLRLGSVPKPMVNSDIYSFGIIVHELLSETFPYGVHTNGEAELIISHILEGGTPLCRPQVSYESHPSMWIELAKSCWHEDSSVRLTFREARSVVCSINGGQLPDLAEGMIHRLEQHTLYLGEMVDQRTAELASEKDKVQTLLCELLPPAVAEQLKNGLQIQPTMHESITIMFTDIVGFTRVCSMSSPMQVVTMLNDLYSRFDKVLNKYDVYKVATIGDAYMVASGVPIPNEESHGSEIVLAALKLVDCIQKFIVPHLPDASLYIRVGVHSGSCVSGVTGIKMPRYLLFGDTIDIAARVEAGGEAMRVHATQPTVNLLEQEPQQFEIEYRGEMAVKGLLPISTYWVSARYQE